MCLQLKNLPSVIHYHHVLWSFDNVKFLIEFILLMDKARKCFFVLFCFLVLGFFCLVFVFVLPNLRFYDKLEC